jgi:5-methylcytosine-specific restriction endonuclease McrA
LPPSRAKLGGMTWTAPPGWRKTRQAVFARYGRSCWRCGAYAGTVDDVIPVVLGGTHHLENLRPACQRCNYRTGAAVGNRLRGQTASYRPWPSSRRW